jgi:beta-glucosidase/6-phospho-beta-glucosidase/beta-galactosidase
MNVFSLVFLLSLGPLWFTTELSNREQWGINSNFESDSIADLVSDLGVGWARLSIDWNRVETSKGIFDWTVPDIEIQRAMKRRLKLFITLGGTPAWANGRRATNVPPLNRQDWYDFVRSVAERYKHYRLVRAYGMWNEPNLKEFWTGGRKNYINLILIPGYMAVKSVNETLLVGAPEMSHQWTGSSEWNLKRIMESAEQYIDVLTQHYYPTKESLGTFLDKKVKPHRSGKEVWITECGRVACSAIACSEDEQSHYYLHLLTAQQARADWITKIFPYRIWDPIDACRVAGNGLGLTCGTPPARRPVFRTYQDFIRGLPFYDPQPDCHPRRSQ